MKRATHSVFILVVAACFAVPGDVEAHGSPTEWSAESTEYGCWVTRWLVRNDGGGETAVGIQVVLGRIVPPRGGRAQPGITQAELEGATTLNVRIFDPSLADAEEASVVRNEQPTVELVRRQLEGELGEFPSFYLAGPAADSALASLGAGRLASIVVRLPDGTEARFANTPEGLPVALAMYDACVKAKPRS
jgi:hypothetical protein